MRDSDIAYQKIKEMIITCKLAPGQVIVDSEMQEELGMGRTPIREALNRLSWENQVRIIPRQCIMVSELPIKSLESIFEMRFTLSVLEAQLVVKNCTEEDTAGLKAIVEETRNEQIPDKRVLLDRKFHQQISKITRNEFLENEMNMLLDLSVRLLFLNKEYLDSINDTVIDEYENMIEAINARDVSKLKKLFQRHVTSFRDKFLK